MGEKEKKQKSKKAKTKKKKSKKERKRKKEKKEKKERKKERKKNVEFKQYSVAYDHTRDNTPRPIRTGKLSSLRPIRVLWWGTARERCGVVGNILFAFVKKKKFSFCGHSVADLVK